MRPAEILRVFQAALEREPLEMRKLGEDVGLLFLVEVLDDVDGVVGIELLQRLGHLLARHGLEHLVAHGLVEFGQRRGVEILAERCDEHGALLGPEQLDEIGKIGLVQRKGEVAQFRRLARIERGNDGVEELGADFALLVAQIDLARFILHGLSVSPCSNVKREGRGFRGSGSAPEETNSRFRACDHRRGSGATRPLLWRNFHQKSA